MSAWDEPFETPQGPPQLEQFAHEGIERLILEAPLFTESMAIELLQICRAHVSVRSAIMYAMQLATDADRTLKTSDDTVELYRAQGKFRGLNQFTTNIIEQLKAAESPEKEKDNALE
jgi:hypothetical protein